MSGKSRNSRKSRKSRKTGNGGTTRNAGSRRKNMYGFVAAVILAPFILFFSFVLLVQAGVFGPVPDTVELSTIRHHEASAVYSSDGELMGTWFLQNRASIDLEEISPVFIDALLSIEDVRFHRHNGLDYRAMVRVLVKTILLGRDSGGGSTITQQLAKNLYPRSTSSRAGLLVDKVRENIVARRLEEIYTKDEILELYLNTVSMGEETFGLEMAARRFFDTTPDRLALHEAATLAGVLRSPTLYNPRRFPDRSLLRRNVVIRQMQNYGMITPAVADSVVALPLDVRYNRITENDGPAPYFREHLRMEVQRILTTGPGLDGNTYNLYTDGLRIETTIDSRVQVAAEQAMATQMARLQASFDRQVAARPVFGKNDPQIIRHWQQTTHYKSLVAEGRSEQEISEVFHQPLPMNVFTWEGDLDRELSPHDSIAHYLNFLNAGFLAMSPQNGSILAWAGGINHRYFQYDHVKSRRQSGSAFKPVIYAAAMEQGMRPCDYQRSELTTYAAYNDWTPRNNNDEYGGYYSMQAALAHSVNTIAVDVLFETGIPNVQQTAARMGITSPVPAEPSIALGTAEVSLLELTSAYTTFANRGIPASPYYLKAIYNKDGDLIYDFANPNVTGTREYAIPPEAAAAMVGMLAKAVDEGTGQALRSRFGIRHALAGKTGTTQNYTDGWFVGMTPDMVFGTWVGGWSPRMRFTGGAGYASQTALPIAGYFLNNLAGQPGLPPQSSSFHPYQQTLYSTSCEDQRDDRFADRVRSFFTGRDADDARVVKPKKERRSLGSRIRGIFRKD
jgi:penicillin-binding protein 1A